jgi:hypothetical protein
MSDPGIVILALSAFSAAAYSIRVIANAVVRHREQDRRIAEASSASVSDERMARLEMAVESIAVEVERISEGQRFTTRLLTEQAQRLTPRLQQGKVDTPH